MNRIIITAVALLLAGPALGQVSVSNADSDSRSKAQQQQGLINNPVNVIEASQIPTETTQRIKNTPSLAIGGPASGPCNGFSAGIGVAVPGFGLTGNMSKVDEGCEERETARIAALMGRMDIANLVLEEMDVVKRAKARRDAGQKPAMTPAKKAEVVPAKPQLVAMSTQITPSEQTRNICEQARLSGDTFIAQRLNCPK